MRTSRDRADLQCRNAWATGTADSQRASMPAQGLSGGAASICREESTGASTRPFCKQFPFWSMASGSQCIVPVGMLKAASVSFWRKTTTSSFAQGERRTSFKASANDHCAGGLCFQKSSAWAIEEIPRSRMRSGRIVCSATAAGLARRGFVRLAWIDWWVAISLPTLPLAHQESSARLL